MVILIHMNKSIYKILYKLLMVGALSIGVVACSNTGFQASTSHTNKGLASQGTGSESETTTGTPVTGGASVGEGAPVAGGTGQPPDSIQENVLQQREYGKLLYAQHCQACHKPLETSTVLNKLGFEIQLAIDTKSSMSSLIGKLSVSDLEAIAVALSTNTGPVISDGPSLPPPPQDINCASPYPNVVQPVSRFTKVQLINTFTQPDWANSTGIRDAVRFILDSIPEDDPIESSADFYPFYTDIQLAAIDRVGNYLATLFKARDLPLVFGACGKQLPITDSCLDPWLSKMGQLAYRRPINETEKTQLRSLFRSAVSPQEGLYGAVFFLATAPDTIYRLESEGTEVAPGVLRITDYEVASRISYLLADQAPDAFLLGKVAAGELRDLSKISSIVDAYLQQASVVTTYQEKLKRFMHYWLQTRMENYPGIGGPSDYLKNPAPGILSLRDEIRWVFGEYDQTLSYLLFKANATFSELNDH